jgi:hypothetical protein
MIGDGSMAPGTGCMVDCFRHSLLWLILEVVVLVRARAVRCLGDRAEVVPGDSWPGPDWCEQGR